MPLIHRALFVWFILLVFLILLALRLDQRIQWNWGIVFIPMWICDCKLLIYIIFYMISYCKNGRVNSLRREIWHMTLVLMKLSAQILICLKLEATNWFLPAKVVLAPFWLLLPILAVDVFIHLIKHCRY
ncbi:hypothetical protein M0802_008506 [Mischocyttarus mexicanus]|nr:hypothetical protein M0802_008506 [Mischocyttarus mexicanus]